MRLVSRRGLIGLVVPGLAAIALARPARAEEMLRFDQLYKSIGVRGMVFADKVRALAGQRVRMRGYAAPPLAAESPFFVLTSEPMTICPFCQSDADWPVDIVCVYLRRSSPLMDGGTRLDVSGKLDIGSWTDPKSGFVSLLRLIEADFRIA